MKHIIFIMFFVAMGFTCMAQNNKGINNKDVNQLNKDLANQVLKMQKIAEQLEHDINSARTLYEKLKDRKYDITSPTSQEWNNLEEYLNSFSSLNDLFTENENDDGIVLKQIDNSGDSDLKSLYQLIFAMKQSLDKPYDEETNDQYIQQASNSSAILPKHKPEFDELVSQINDYNYYMFELARLFKAADEDNYSKSAKKLVEDEDAKYLMNVPYTSKMLRLYIDSEGNLKPEEKDELKAACSDAFPDF